ncbi:RIHA-like protein [Mya arenaria]|uniref:RIHA-like protein n=1 Tax=Mya arenaria TaxID=6604 RepID=A0ABY7E8G1_MYAAR|nr:RIHA-like protein [Mya arenaria]
MSTPSRRKLLIDTDAGVDDAQAILMALKCPDVDVIGITCVAGNADAMQVGKNVLRVDYHGSDGFGDVPDPEAPDDSLLESEHAVNALMRLSKKQEGKGNMTVAAEFNFYFDPEAAYVVLNQLKAPITIVTWETCMEHSIPWEFYSNIRDKGGDVCNFLSKIEKKSCEYAKKQKWATFMPADEYLIACVLRPNVIKTCCDVYATVDVKGHYTWGQMIVDWQKVLKRPNNVCVVTDINQDIFEGMLADLFINKDTHRRT